MAEQKGIELLLKLGNGASPEVFSTVGGCATNAIRLNEQTIDVTSKDHADRFRRLIRGGVKTVQFTGAGRFVDDAAVGSVRTNFFGSAVANWQIVVPSFGTFEAPCILTDLEFNGEHTDAVQQSMTVESAGSVTFTAA